MLECKLSRPDADVTWYKDGKEITPDDNVEIVVDGKWRRLRIKTCALDDEAEYSVIVGNESSRAMLWVEGRFTHTVSFVVHDTLLSCIVLGVNMHTWHAFALRIAQNLFSSGHSTMYALVRISLIIRLFRHQSTIRDYVLWVLI